MIEVVAALIWKNNDFLICQRPDNKSCGLLWEFPGGKVKSGETKELALVRECYEELGVVLSLKNEVMSVTHSYPEVTIHLTLFNSTIESGDLQKVEHKDIRWIGANEINQYDFCPADINFLDTICTIAQ